MIRLRESRYDRGPERSRTVHCCTGIKYCEADTGTRIRFHLWKTVETAYRWHANNVRPIPICSNPLVSQRSEIHRKRPTGANGVAWCFSAANIRTDMTRAAVMNISMKTPCARFVPCCKKVLMEHTCVHSVVIN